MRKIKDRIYSVGAVDWDRKYFDELIPLPQGTSYNSFIVQGSQKTALMDTVEPGKVDVLIKNLVAAGVAKIDYIVAHHGEQDHSGSIGDILMMYPEAKVVCNKRCRDLLIELLHLDTDVFIVVEDAQELSLGDKTLKFIFTPWVHWPETMSTYLVEDRILFSCDFFGAHIASSDLFVNDEAETYISAKRYYAEIMMPFRKQIQKNLKKLADYDIQIIAPSHGLLYDNPSFIMDAYADWVSDDVKNQVIIAFVSMHESTRIMSEHLIDYLAEQGVQVKFFNLMTADEGELAISLVDAATIVIGSPTMLAGAHPKAAYAAILANILKPKAKCMTIVGSYSWGGKMVEQLTSMMSNLSAELLEPVLIKGLPKDQDLTKLDDLAEKILARHKELGILN